MPDVRHDFRSADLCFVELKIASSDVHRRECGVAVGLIPVRCYTLQLADDFRGGAKDLLIKTLTGSCCSHPMDET